MGSAWQCDPGGFILDRFQWPLNDLLSTKEVKSNDRGLAGGGCDLNDVKFKECSRMDDNIFWSFKEEESHTEKIQPNCKTGGEKISAQRVALQLQPILLYDLNPDGSKSELNFGSAWQNGSCGHILDRSKWHGNHFLQLDKVTRRGLIGADILNEVTLLNNLDTGSIWLVDPSCFDPSWSFWPTDQNGLDVTEQLNLNHGMDNYGLDALLSNCGDLSKLIRCAAYFLRMVGRALRKESDCGFDKEISAREYVDAFKFLIACYKFAITLIVVGGKVANFPMHFSKDNKLPTVAKLRPGKTLAPAVIGKPLVIVVSSQNFTRQKFLIAAHILNWPFVDFMLKREHLKLLELLMIVIILADLMLILPMMNLFVVYPVRS